MKKKNNKNSKQKPKYFSQKPKQFSQKSKNIWSAIIFLVLILWAAITALYYSPYSVAVGVLIGFLSSRIINNIKN